MPSPTPYRNLARSDFPGKLKRSSPPIPPRARQLVELMTWGDGTSEPLTLREAAAAMSISFRTARKYFAHPRARQYWQSLFSEMRDSEKPRSFHVARTIRDNQEMAKSAAGNRARTEAMRFIKGRDGIDVNVNVGIGVGIEIQPGYLCDVTPYAEAGRKLLKTARSTRSVLDGHVSEGVVVDERAAPERGTPTPVDAADERPARPPGEPEPFHLFKGPTPSNAKPDAPARSEPNHRRG